MPVNCARTLTAGPLTLPNVAASIGALHACGGREEAEGRAIAVELPAVLELIDAVGRGHVTAEQARAAFAPLMEVLAEYTRQADFVDELSWRG